MRLFSILMIAVTFSLGCAKMQVGGTKDPIKVDISMRLDIYQHVENDIDAIENIVSGAKENKKSADKQSFLEIFIAQAYAQEGLSPEVEQAALRRKGRVLELSSREEKGVVGENKNGLVEIRDSQTADKALSGIVAAENNDRMIIYQAVAKKNGTSLEEVQGLYSKRLQSDAPVGTPIEVLNEWKIK